LETVLEKELLAVLIEESLTSLAEKSSVQLLLTRKRGLSDDVNCKGRTIPKPAVATLWDNV
jgi:hypothetical protein